MALQFGNQSKSYLSELVKLGLNSPKAFGYEQLTISSSVQNLTIPAGATYAKVSVESSVTSGIVARYLEFGGTVTAVAIGTGIPLYNGTVFEITDFADLNGFQVILETAGTTKLNIQYYK